METDPNVAAVAASSAAPEIQQQAPVPAPAPVDVSAAPAQEVAPAAPHEQAPVASAAPVDSIASTAPVDSAPPPASTVASLDAAPPAAHSTAPADDAQTAAAAQAAVAPAPPTIGDAAADKDAGSGDQGVPGHDSDVKGLNGTGVAEVGALAPGASEAHDEAKPPIVEPITTQSLAPPPPVSLPPMPSAPLLASNSAVDVKQEADVTANGQAPSADVEMHDGTTANGATDSAAAKRQRKSVTRFDSATDDKPRLAGPDATDMTPTQIKFAQNSIKALKARREAVIFKEPVDWQALNIPHYPTIISTPMDLGTIDLKLALTAAASKGGNKPTDKTREAEKWGLDPVRDVYQSVEQWEDDVRLVFLNSYTFNGADHPVSASAKALEEVFEKQLKSMPAEPEPVAPLATARRSSTTDAGGRPKRDIHPPPSKDLPYAEPQSATSSRKRRKPKSQMTPREQAYYARVAADEIKFCKSVVTELLGQKHSAVAWVFYDLPARDLDFAPAYYNMIKRPIALTQIRDKLARGEYADADSFDADMQLLFSNCFTFNPPDSDVHVMGQKVKDVYEGRMAKMPQPKAMTPEYDDDEDAEGEEDAEGDDDDEEDEADEIEALRTQIAALQARLKELEKAKSKKGSGGKKAAAASSAAGKKRKGSDAAATAAPAKKKAAPKKPRTSSISAPAGGAASPSDSPAPKKAKTAAGGASSAKKPRASGSSKKATSSAIGAIDDDDVRAVTYEQKEELAAKITQMPDDRLEGALRIIAEDKPPSANDDEEIELDIDDLSPKTLYKLYRYVVRPKKKPNVPKIGAHDGRRKGTGGLKRKNLDEDAEAARIARLQEQLSAFDNAEAAGPAAQPAGTHDDLVQSESSEEEESESESDYE